jgi:acyl-CoA synthetase (AMP-forming)/AMP-acid ligase II
LPLNRRRPRPRRCSAPRCLRRTTVNTLLTSLAPDRLREHYRSGFWRDDTIYSLVQAHALATPDKIAIANQHGGVSYAGLIAAADAFALDLGRRGLRAGQRVAAWLPSRIETAIVVLACSREGFVCCPSLHRNHTVEEVIALLQKVRAAALVVQEGYGADADHHDIADRLCTLESLRAIYRLPPSGAGQLEQLSRVLLTDGKPATLPPAPTASPDRIVYLAFTSGTTGEPKGVLHSDNTLLANARSLAADWDIGTRSVVCSLSPLSHNLGFGALVMTLAVGGQLVVNDLRRDQSLVDRLNEVGATFLFGVPTHAIDLLRELRARPGAGVPTLKGFRISGSAATREVLEELLQYGILPQSGYGMTETCSHQYTLPTDSAKRIAETCGHACPGYEIRIWDRSNADVELPVGEIGQIGGRGASLMLGYFDDQASTEDAFNSLGWFMTGDLGSLDADGYLRIVGRKKDIIVRGGHNIYPARIEALATQLPAIRKAAAVPIADTRLGEKVCLSVAFHSGQTLAPTQVLAHLHAAGLSKYDMPEYFLAVTELPETASGKIRKAAIIELIATGALKPMPVRWDGNL